MCAKWQVILNAVFLTVHINRYDQTHKLFLFLQLKVQLLYSPMKGKKRTLMCDTLRVEELCPAKLI